MAGVALPGSDPEAVDTTQLHRLVRQSLPLSEIAQTLDTSLDAVRHALTRHPAPDHLRSRAFRRAPVLTDLAKGLPATTLPSLYCEQKLSLRAIAACYGAEQKAVGKLAREYGIVLRPPQKPRRHEEIDGEWLRAEYIANRRSLPDLAAEKGMSATTMSRWCQYHGIERRGPTPRLCAAIVDRLTFGGNIIETGTDSYRLAATKNQGNR